MSLTQIALERRLGQPFRYFERIGSTNDNAKAWLLAGAEEGAAVIANEQTRGRGRHGKVWHTPPDVALALSVILKPPAELLPRVNMIGALSVYDLARACGCDAVALKWPNDVLVRGKKVSGVLPEPVWRGSALAGVALGIGVNIGLGFPSGQLAERATSLEAAAGRPLDRARLIAGLLARVAHWRGLLETDLPFSTWRERLATLNAPAHINGIRGTAVDAQADGALVIRDAAGRLHRVYAGDLLPEGDGGKPT